MSIWLGIVLLAAAALALRRVFAGYPAADPDFAYVSPREARFLASAAEAMFPAGGAIPLSGVEADLPRFADRYLAVVHPRVRLQMRMLFLLFAQATLVFPAPGRGGHRRFSDLGVEQRMAVLRGWSESALFVRALVFTALRAVLTMGYLGHPVAMRHLRVAPLDFETPVLEPDLLYPPIGKGPESIRYATADLTPPSDGTPLDPHGPLRADYREAAS